MLSIPCQDLSSRDPHFLVEVTILIVQLSGFRFGVRHAVPLSISFSGWSEKSKQIESTTLSSALSICFSLGPGKNANRKRHCMPHSKSKTLLPKRQPFYCETFMPG